MNNYLEALLDKLQFPHSESSDRFETIIQEFEAIPKVFVCIFEIGITSRFLYYSNKIEDLIGHPASKFLNDVNFSFMKSLTPERFLTYVSKKQKEYIDECQQPGFDYKAPQFMTFHAALYDARGVEVPITQYSVPLFYNADGIHELAIGVNFLEQNNSNEFFKKESSAKILLTELKRIFVSSFPHRFENIKPKPWPLTLLYNPKSNNFKEPSNKEKEVLKFIARGLSTREIAKEMGTTPNTIETHRKHLLEKFEAKNTAELVQKASKIYWLE